MKVKSFFVLFLLALSSLSFASVYKSNAKASYYAEKFHGRKTANGEIFNMNAMTCAHKTLPFGTVLRVTNLGNNKSVDVRVNDRGPFVKGRELDLSKEAAKKIGMIKNGTANVRIEILGIGNDVYKTSVAKTTSVEKKTVLKSQASDSAKIWDIQVGSFSNKENANRLAQNLLKEGFEDVYFQKTSSVVRVVIKNVADSELESVEKKLRSAGCFEYVLKKNS